MTSPGLGIILDPYFLYTYGKGLETEASRFSQPGDFFTFLAFVCIVILVSGESQLPGVPKSFPYPKPPISARPVSSSCDRFLEVRKITPALFAVPSFANPYKGSVRSVGMVEIAIEKIA